MSRLETQTAPAAATPSLAASYRRVRDWSASIASLLEPEDCVIQSMPDVSPTRWHLAHTTWFFETFLLRPLMEREPYDEAYEHLFNSYYNSVGAPFPQDRRGLLSRPTVEDVMRYRSYVDRRVGELLERDAEPPPEIRSLLVLGLQHEQQHQELMLTDIKHVFSCNPLYPPLQPDGERVAGSSGDDAWVEFDGGIVEVGHDGDGFCYDNECPRHRVLLEPFALASRPVTNGEYLRFINDGGYSRPELWLSMGWSTVVQEGWEAPLHWVGRGDRWFEFTLGGLRPLDAEAPVCHVSYFEADAYARWAGYRLPTEFEWEIACEQSVDPTEPDSARWADVRLPAGQLVHPSPRRAGGAGPSQMFGDVWEWTASPYAAYPGYRPAEGAIGEYNGKFMCNQYVLRGGSCATPSGHLRSTYRNFFPPDARWQFSGLRLAR